MAAAGKKNDKQDDEDEAVAAAAVEAKKKKKKLLLIIGLVVLLAGISIGVTLVALKMLSPKTTSGEEQSSEPAETVEKAEPAQPANYFALKPNFTVNYDVNGRQRFLQTELTLMYRNEAVLKVLELHMPAVRNGLVLLLSNQTFDELQTAEGKEKLRAAALKTVQDILTKEQAETGDKSNKDAEKDKSKAKDKKSLPNIEQVLFTHFVMQ